MINMEYGVSSKDLKDISFWPKNVQTVYHAMIAARERLYPLINDGKPYAKYIKEVTELSNHLMKEIDNESKQ